MAKLTGRNALITGDSRTIRVTAPDLDLTGYTVTFTVKSESALATDSDAGALIQKVVTTHTAPTAGITDIELTATDTRIAEGKYVYDIQFTDPSGSKSSSARQDIEFKYDVTKA